MSKKDYEGKEMSRKDIEEQFKRVSSEHSRTPYGWCLRRAFTIGEWQDKIYRFAEKAQWNTARENAEGILHIEKTLNTECGVDTKEAIYYMEELIKAIDNKDWRETQRLIDEHDLEILTAFETAQHEVNKKEAEEQIKRIMKELKEPTKALRVVDDVKGRIRFAWEEPWPVNNVFNGTSKEKYYLNFNRDEIFKNLIASEGHFRNFKSLKEDTAGYLNCIVKHLADAEGHCDEAISHALIAENEESSRSFLELRDEIRKFRKWIQSSPITRDEGIREIRKLRRSFESYNPEYDVSKCETCGDPATIIEEITKILDDLKKTPLEVAAHEHLADEFLLMERDMAEKLITKLSDKYGIKPPKIEILDTCHEPSDASYMSGHIYVCRSGVNLHVLAHEFWHHVQNEKGMHLDEGEAEKYAVELFEKPVQKGLYSFHNHSHSERKMVKSIKDVGMIYGLQQLGYAADYGLKYADSMRPAGFLGQPISFWGDILGTIGGVAGALYLRAPYDLVSAMVGGYLSTNLWNQLMRLVPAGLATPPLVYTPAGTTPRSGLVYTPTPATTTTRPTPTPTKGRYVVTG